MNDFDIFDEFDTIIIFGNSIPIATSQEKLDKLLDKLVSITTEDGKMIGNFVTPLPVKDQIHLAYHQKNRENN